MKGDKLMRQRQKSKYAQRPAQMSFNLDGFEFNNHKSLLTKTETKVYDLIPKGKENAVSAEYLAQMLKVGTRAITDIVRRLKLKYCDVGSLRDVGYYRFKDQQEYLEYMAIATKEQARRNQVLTAMRHTPMAQSLMADLNEREKKNEKIHD
ncbi:hypothetical protein QFX17_07940 [Lactobacillus helveticus]|uniref:hypothetical protein n=2 Tax=Lactobacillus helveticus TaxID=1587 RepID=UPI0021C2E062|nr:hypothetical protein [Lactobacillus helveticus]MCP9317817.1 hypothetical protein [Lactobacillus helveticus]MDH5818140.1 hypothetical protein [Lactobacillus helveticus]